jgi:phage pi2 protein 07
MRLSIGTKKKRMESAKEERSRLVSEPRKKPSLKKNVSVMLQNGLNYVYKPRNMLKRWDFPSQLMFLLPHFLKSSNKMATKRSKRLTLMKIIRILTLRESSKNSNRSTKENVSPSK